jgi:predicted AAA+ superfamily ATPase
MSELLQQYRFLKNILPAPSSRKLVLLTGARQTGKTTLALDKYPQLRHINLDAPEDRETLRAISSASWGRDIGNAVLDEAQKEPIVFDKVKYAYDRKDITFSILLGSSQILLLKKIRESLAGRISLYELWPLMMSEIYWEAGSKSVELPLVEKLSGSDTLGKIMKNVPSVLTETEDNPRRRAEDYLLQWGGMPALLPLANEERWKWMRDYEYTYLERDLADLARLSDLSPFSKFQKLAALRSAKLLNYSELARDTGLSVDTAKRYLEYLRISYQTVLLQPYHKNITSSVVKTPKVYWTDIGLLRHLTGFRGELTGEIYETMVVGELYKWVKTSQKDAELSFYRSRSGLEIDILMEAETGIIGMEIKARKIIAPKDTTPMKDVAAVLGEKWRGGMVIYAGNEIRKIAEPDIWAVPSRRLFI